MGAFNELIVSNDSGETRVQFKEGVIWQYQYKLGDNVRFKEDDPLRLGQHFIRGLCFKDGQWQEYRLKLENGVVVSADIIAPTIPENAR